MEKVKMKYIGTVPTLARTERNGAKVEVEPGTVVEMDKDVALGLGKTYKNVWVPEGFKTPAKVEGGLDESKVEKTVPKKAKK